MHVDDIGLHARVRPYVQLTARGGVVHGIEWTPECYHKLRKQLTEEGKHKVKRDVIGWKTSRDNPVYEIDQFTGMHLLELPLHEEPWQGDRQQYVYIIEASIHFDNYRQILYLQRVESAHNRIYEMFAYSDFFWTRKYVQRIFQINEASSKHELRKYNRRLHDYILELYPK